MPMYCVLKVHSIHTHTHTHTHILIPFEDREPTGLKVDIAQEEKNVSMYQGHPDSVLEASDVRRVLKAKI